MKVQAIVAQRKTIVEDAAPTPANSVGDVVSKMNATDASKLLKYLNSLDAPPAATTAAPAPAPTTTQPANLFNDPKSLATAWAAYKEAGGKFNPALRQIIKDIWMNMGGIKAESKNYKK